MKKSFENSKGGALSFGKVAKAVTGKRVAHKSNKTVKGQVGYSVKTKYAGVAFGLALFKEANLKFDDTINAVIVKADVDTGDDYVDTLLDSKVLKFARKVNKGKLNLGDKHRIAIDRTLSNISDRNAIDKRLTRLRDYGFKAEAKEIKQFIKDNKTTDGFEKNEFNKIFALLADYNADDFLTKYEVKKDEYIASL